MKFLIWLSRYLLFGIFCITIDNENYFGNVKMHGKFTILGEENFWLLIHRPDDSIKFSILCVHETIMDLFDVFYFQYFAKF